MADKKEIITLLDKIADLMEYMGENPFKMNAFRNGANTLRSSEEEIEELIKTKELNKLKRIGKRLQAVIYEFNETGNSSLLSELKKDVPSGIDELLKVRGLGPKKIKLLYTELGISNIGELEYACKENRLALLKGFGNATQIKILNEIEKSKVYNKYILLNTAEEYSDQILERISDLDSITEVAITGELRRGMEIISELQFIVLTKDNNKVCKEISKNFKCKKLDKTIEIKDGFSIPIKIFTVQSEEEFTHKLFETTGSKEFLDRINYNPKDILPTRDEKEIFKNLNVPFIIPEMREPEYLDVRTQNLLHNSDLSFDHMKGLLHFHTTYSNGRNSLIEMLREAEKKGFQYVAVCDHSKSAFYANGLSRERILLQKQEITRNIEEFNLLLFHGIESDILHDGQLDYEDDFLVNFDFIVASIHSRFHMEHDEMTRRIIKAVENPYTDLLAHPTGRLLLSRDPYKVDMKKIIDACAANKVAIEINANPHRLDLDWRMIYYARDKGCLFSINPDAHSTEDISYIKYGIMVGRKGSLQSNEVINCYDKNKFIDFLNRKVKRNLGN